MPESPLSPTAYEVLGVAVTANSDELRRAYRKRLRETHPDTGGSASEFNAVQLAWEQLGTPQNRAAYDRGNTTSAGREEQHVWAPSAPRPQTDSRPRARSHGHPGGRAREKYLTLIREWVGRGVPLPDPYDPALVRSAPAEIRHALADALAEEASAQMLSTLGIGFTLWHDVAAGRGLDDKIDHVVLGPSGLFAVQSEDWGTPIRVRRGDLVGESSIGEAQPLHSLSGRVRGIARATHVKFSAIIMVLPDDALDNGITLVGKSHGVPMLVVQRSRLLSLLRTGVPDAPRAAGTDLFEVRTRLQNGIHFA